MGEARIRRPRVHLQSPETYHLSQASMVVGADPHVGSSLAGYGVERVLGRGGMSVVYLADDAHPAAPKQSLDPVSDELVAWAQVGRKEQATLLCSGGS